MSNTAWGAAVDAMFDNANMTGEPVSFSSVAEASSFEQKHNEKRNASFNLNGLKIEPKEKINPREYVPKKNDDSPCQRTIKRQEQLKAKWKMDKLQLQGETPTEELSDAARCERFNSKASEGTITRLDYVLTR